jgi:hypothetical protein
MFTDVRTITLLSIDINVQMPYSTLDDLLGSYIPPNKGAPRRIIIDATSRIQDNMAKGGMRERDCAVVLLTSVSQPL